MTYDMGIFLVIVIWLAFVHHRAVNRAVKAEKDVGRMISECKRLHTENHELTLKRANPCKVDHDTCDLCYGTGWLGASEDWGRCPTCEGIETP